jgi:methenyltetrahydromethanopterin cyclohydrolase
MDTSRWPGLNALAAPLADKLEQHAAEYRVSVSRGTSGERLIDAGAHAPGGLGAGIVIAETCMAGLGRVSWGASGITAWPVAITVQSSHPVAACLASQYAGWSLSHKEEGKKYSVLGSGPGRAMAAREDLFAELGYRDQPGPAVFVLETDAPPPAPLVLKIADACRTGPENLTFIYAPTQSLAGSFQVVARVLEVALHKAHALKFPLENIADGIATAPLSPPSPDFLQAMGRTNDAIIFGGHAQLFVRGSDAAAEALANDMPSSASRDYGAPFAEIFARYKQDFYAIDPMLFSPASIAVTALDSGRTFRAGRFDPDLVERSFCG